VQRGGGGSQNGKDTLHGIQSVGAATQGWHTRGGDSATRLGFGFVISIIQQEIFREAIAKSGRRSSR
jgi:hypothetical protein